MTEISINEVIAHVKQEVAAKRLDGSYPPGLEAQLEQEFRLVLDETKRKYASNLSHYSEALESIRSQVSLLNGRTSTRSRIPGVSIIHKIAEFLGRRQMRGFSSQVREIQVTVLNLIENVCLEIEQQSKAEDNMVRELYAVVLDRIAILDHMSLAYGDLQNRLVVLEQNQETKI